MRATMRITWPLLSLCFLLHGPCSNADTATAPSVIKIDASSQPGPALSSNAVSNPPAAAVTSVDVSTVKVATMAPTPANQPPAATRLNPGVTAVAITQPNKPITNNQQPTTVANKPTQPTTVNPGAVSTLRNDAKTAVVNTIKPASTPQAAPAPTTDSSNTFVATTDAAAQTAGAGGQTSGTQRPVSHGNPGTTKITNILTDAPTTGHQPDTHFTFTTKTSQDSKGGTQGTTVMTTSSHQTAAKTQGPAGNPTTTLNPSTPTKTGTPAAVSFATKAAATSPQPTTTTTPTAPTTAARPKMFSYSLNTGQEKEEEKDLVEVCRRLMVSLQDGNCTLIWKHHNGKIQFESVEINGKVKTGLAAQYYEEITRKPTDNKTLIAILASCGALLIMIVILAVCASHHRKPYHENQQHLTEELHTVENGYHDNPTLEVMEVQPEMQEKKKALNGEFNDSWIVPIDNLLKEDIADEEDTHL